MLFKTPHGSHLYGLAHENSDKDYYVVLDKQKTRRAKYAKHSIVDGIDTMTVDFGTWIDMCQAGVPQALEAMFSRMPIVDNIPAFRSQFRVGDGIRDTYYRTVENFMDEDNFKKNRHALRLALNLRDGLRYGRFDPTLSKRQQVYVTFHAKHTPFEQRRELALHLAST